MWNWKNDCVKSKGEVTAIPYSRFIASWISVGGNLKTGEDLDRFKEWLRSLEVDEESVQDIYDMATNGKLELETSARKFILNA